MKDTKKLALIAVIIGIGLITISQTVKFTKKQSLSAGVNGGWGDFMSGVYEEVEDTSKKNMFLYSGLLLAIVGGVGYVISMNKQS